MRVLPSWFPIPTALRSKAFRAACTCGLTLLFSACIVEDADKYIGKDPYITFQQKFMVDQMTMPFPNGRPGVDWGMSLVWLGDHYLLTADENTTPSHDPQIWQIVAIRDIPLLKAGQMFAMGTCIDDQQPAPGVVAVIQYDLSQDWFTDIRGAWKYDFDKQEIVDYPTAKLACQNPRYGLGEDLPPMMSTNAPPLDYILPPLATVAAPQAATLPSPPR